MEGVFALPALQKRKLTRERAQGLELVRAQGSKPGSLRLEPLLFFVFGVPQGLVVACRIFRCGTQTLGACRI